MTVSRSLLLRALPLAFILIISQSPPQALAEDPGPPVCSAPKELLQLGPVLPRVKALLAGERPVKIVAVGSSSTARACASSPAMTYPSRLEAELRGRFPKSSITVLNRGANGGFESGSLSGWPVAGPLDASGVTRNFGIDPHGGQYHFSDGDFIRRVSPATARRSFRPISSR